MCGTCGCGSEENGVTIQNPKDVKTHNIIIIIMKMGTRIVMSIRMMSITMITTILTAMIMNLVILILTSIIIKRL